ncbi:MAG TPA: hypothetical protein VFH60_02130, partial [Chloroflexia bacterium]|nr:hypothetical protein [Chloroflexia bacterium]
MADTNNRDNTGNTQPGDHSGTTGTQAVAEPQSSAPTVPPAPALPPMNPIERPGPTSEEWPEEQRRVLLVAAHPDDPEFSSAGTVA